ncbi:MAG: trans-sulfuration enzyme family protein [Acidobacteriota bacterium]
MSDHERIHTKLIHAGEPEPRIGDAVAMPIFQSSTYLSRPEDEDYHDIRYARLNNTPNHAALHAKLAALEGAEAALVAGSGMAAISTTLLALLRSGDHMLMQDVVYGGTLDLVAHDLPELGIEHDVFDPLDPDSWKDRLRPDTKVIYAEAITNPLIQVGELDAVPRFAREHGLVSMIDNTFASPVNFRPAEHGYDLSLHSATKYLNGHSDVIAGAVIGRADLVEKVLHKLNHLGGTLDAHACFLLHRGLKTLALRMAWQNASAQQLAEWLDAHPRVETVNYPGLPDHRDHERAERFLDGCGGMLSFELSGSAEDAAAFVDRLRLPLHAPSLGGVETLVTRPATTSHSGLTPEERERAGVSDRLIRVSVGIEAPEDLIADMDQALSG